MKATGHIIVYFSLLFCYVRETSSFASINPRTFLAKGSKHVTVRNRLYYVGENPNRVAIEEAAGQLDPVKLNATDHEGVHGLTSKSPSECRSYGCEVQDEKLRAKLERLTKPRAYPLFLMEKAAKILGDLVPQAAFKKVSVNGVAAATKEKLVVLGTGWGAAALLAEIDNDRYDVTVISPRNFFLFTPMLAGASVGTVDARSITQPIREFNRQANYLEAAASSVDTDARIVTCQGVQCDEECEIIDIQVPYDRLVVAVGARTNTFGIPGVEEHCLFLKQINDARQIRRRIVSLFETANFPGQTEEERRKLLTFAVIGAGPTGVEFAAELRDFVEEDGPKYYPHLLKDVSIKIIEATPVILRPFDESLRETAMKVLTRGVKIKDPALQSLFPEELTELVINNKVKEVTADTIDLDDGKKIPYGMAVWAGGIGPLPITLNIIDAIGGKQKEAQEKTLGQLAVDPWLRAMNGEGRIFALGDCACTQMACLPSTAQVAAQQGEFLAHILSKANLDAEHSEEGVLLPPQRNPDKPKNLMDSISSFAVQTDEYMAPFQFLDMGILAYTGDFSALAQVQVTPNEKTRVKASGKVGFDLWRSVYWMKQASMRNRTLVAIDWIKSRLFGRDITAID